MAERVLSQNEIDALMKGISKGEIETETDKKNTGGIRSYDLTSQDRVVRGRMPTMEIINERFCRLFRISLSNFIRKMVDVTGEGPKTIKYGEFLKNVPLPASFNIFQMPPLRGLSLLVFDANLIFLLVDNYFGGGGKYHMRVEGREFSNLEQRVIRRLADVVFRDMKTSWQTVQQIDCVHNRSEVNPQFVNVVVPTEVMIVNTFTIEIETNKSQMAVAIPYSTVEGIKEKLYAAYQSDRMEVDKRWLQRFEEEIRKSSISMVCEMGRAEVSLDEFIKLNIGDVIQLDKGIDDKIILKAEGIPKFTGMTGMSGGQYAIQIAEVVGKEGN